MSDSARKTVRLFHTAPALVAVFDALAAELAPWVVLRHTVREDLLKRAIDLGQATPEVIEAAASAIAEQTHDDIDAVVCTCSTIGAAADLANATSNLPVFRIDRAMARESLMLGERILVLATLRTTIEPTVSLLKSEAGAMGRAPTIESMVLDEARALFLSGDTDRYLQAVADGINAAALDADVVVLAQASMAAALPLVKAVNAPILTSPRIGFAWVTRELSGLAA
ncbi:MULTISPECIES: aspartate/glutamate racemase family protein [unclassified Mesorhizobium]|uniref:aspartate/glutamate racemase family protein n=1 Tax=unclassified Mesorhizobium TaxID=325217 RepID=UPI000FD2E4F6|nr:MULTISPECIES: aspartate/glutamate racemase family protein [unclassified Mesorhizobium]RUV95476.1 arylsulfatase [Mesorhizobium sp. M5C.F.Ca.IN.020.14.1.1]RUV31006.1 arylsulfatase [Mesorhizobium sp. M5C.F.Ca.IN.020.32.2.1]RWC45052.1 MAG: arylsulfatase [Mesorhizobium sp.]RWD51881.1 MAG: arylsulfatase [Mesorhizobium sp.]RWE62017.1 MAG: arylsulfatase [Mesorhizobium sp.]